VIEESRVSKSTCVYLVVFAAYDAAPTDLLEYDSSPEHIDGGVRMVTQSWRRCRSDGASGGGGGKHL